MQHDYKRLVAKLIIDAVSKAIDKVATGDTDTDTKNVYYNKYVIQYQLCNQVENFSKANSTPFVAPIFAHLVRYNPASLVV